MAVATGSATEEKQDEAKAASPPKEKKAVATEYVILKGDPGDGSWTMVGSGSGTNRLDAIKSVLGENAAEGSYKAVPTRSWQETVEVASETKTVTNFRPKAG